MIGQPGEYARDEEGDGFREVRVNTMEGFWKLLLRPEIWQKRLPSPPRSR